MSLKTAETAASFLRSYFCTLGGTQGGVLSCVKYTHACIFRKYLTSDQSTLLNFLPTLLNKTWSVLRSLPLIKTRVLHTPSYLKILECHRRSRVVTNHYLHLHQPAGNKNDTLLMARECLLTTTLHSLPHVILTSLGVRFCHDLLLCCFNFSLKLTHI